jgi:hypothetical protein
VPDVLTLDESDAEEQKNDGVAGRAGTKQTICQFFSLNTQTGR